jgi:hypothetical protein
MADGTQQEFVGIHGFTVGEKLESWYKMFQKLGNGGHMIMLEVDTIQATALDYPFPKGVFKLADMPTGFRTFHYEPI